MEIAADHLQKDRLQHTHPVITIRVTPMKVHKLNCKKRFFGQFDRQIKKNTPRRIRTPSLLVRSQTLYPVELWAHILPSIYLFR